MYAKLLAFQTGGAATGLPEGAPEDGPSAASMLTSTQAEMLRLLEGIDAETLYRMTKVGHEEYSPLSLLENVTMHDGEHLAQIEGLLRTASGKQRSKGAGATSVRVRPATNVDLAAMNEIYNYYSRETPITVDIDEWTTEQRRAWFEKFALTGRHRLFVAEEGGRVIGFAGTGMFRPKAAYETTPETTIYCAPEAAGRGTGSLLYEALFDALRDEDIHGFIAGITLPNDASCRLHERFGFTRAGVMHGVGRKFGRYWDVAWYERPAGAGR
jgi:phosphinothricin acetyltransferase